MLRTYWAGHWAKACVASFFLASSGMAAPPDFELPPTKDPVADIVSAPASIAPISAQEVPAPPPKPAAAPVAPAADIQPAPLKRPLEPAAPSGEDAIPSSVPAPSDTLLRTPVDPPLGFSGPSGILPRDEQQDSHFVPMEDRWRAGFPAWDRYGKGHKITDDYPYDEGSILNPYKQNIIKGDYPIIGQHTFFNLTVTDAMLFEGRQTPTATTPFESTSRPFENEFFGRPSSFSFNNNLIFNMELFHGDAGFKIPDWQIVLTPIFNINAFDTNELGVINPDVRKGTSRNRTYFALQEWFLDTKLADTSPDFDTVNLRVGAQPFTSDFRGFLFSDVNRGMRLFGTRNANREQYNLVYFRQEEKDTNSGLNKFDDRGQDILIANYFRQDTIWPGYTFSASVHYNHDQASKKFDNNHFLVRPDPDGTFQQHELNVVYLGWAGDGHINRYNITHQVYWAMGRDSGNPLANKAVDINAGFAAVELSYDRDWARFRTSFLWSSGDHDINNSHATGFDSIQDSPNFAGGDFSFFQRQAIGLFGVNLVQRESLIPDLRSSKIQGQSNFVNPGLLLLNFGFDVDITPKWKMINNCNFLWFDDTNVLEEFAFQHNINRQIGTDISVGFEYRPLLSNNIIARMGMSTLIPGTGFKQLYNQLRDNVDPLIAGFLELTFTY